MSNTISKKPAIIIDFDTFSTQTKDKYFKVPEVEELLWEYRNAGCLILLVSNCSDLAFGKHSQGETDERFHSRLKLFDKNPVHFVRVSYNDEKGNTEPHNFYSFLTKPNIGMLALLEGDAYEENIIIDWKKSRIIGNKPLDKKFAKNAGIEYKDLTTLL